jgi:hypothetical protein
MCNNNNNNNNTSFSAMSAHWMLNSGNRQNPYAKFRSIQTEL